MKILVTGKNSQLARQIIKDLKEGKMPGDFHKPVLYTFDRSELDITDWKTTFQTISTIDPDIIINCASYNHVDDAERDLESAKAINDDGLFNISACAENVSARLIHFSTDYVFDGKKKEPYTEEDEASPINNYGLTKRDGEKKALRLCRNSQVIRTSWLYSSDDGNFASTIIKKLKDNEKLSIVDDQRGTPTSVEELSKQLFLIMKSDITGLIHASASGDTTWYEYACTIARLLGIKADISPITSEQLGRKARRPKYSVMENARLKKLGLDIMRPWDTVLEEFMIAHKYI